MEADSGIVLTLYFSGLCDGFLIDAIFLLRMVASPELGPSCENHPQNGSLKKSLRAKVPFSKPVALKMEGPERMECQGKHQSSGVK